jgi:hypothetical protein
MANSKFKIFQIMEKIHASLVETSLNLATYQFLNDQLSSNPFKIAPIFFQTTSNATLREAILGITRLTDENQESINFKLLLDMVENHPQLFKHSPVEARNLVEANRQKLASLEPLLKAMRPVRDRELAHLDRKHLNDPAVLFSEPLAYQDLSRCLEILAAILSDIWQALLGEPLPDNQETGQILNELEAFWEIIEKDMEKVGQSE